MTCRERLETYLRSQQVPFGVHPHEPAYTTQGVAEREHIPAQLMVKVVMAIADGEPVMLALPTTRRVELARLRTLLGAHTVRLADESELAACFPDCDLGAMPPFGNLYGMRVFVDRSLVTDRAIFFQAGSHRIALSIAYVDFLWLVAPTVGEFTHVHRRPTALVEEEAQEIGGW
jgi:Ala-tRNA(Pro) deacylase